MSSYIVSDNHINALVSYGVQQKASFYVPKEGWIYFTEETAPAIAALLYRHNVYSVNANYGERTRATGFEYKPVSVSHLSAAAIVRACDCLDYQSCDRKDWDRSRAKKALTSIREKAISDLVKGCKVWELAA
jgi:hypothetical protein